jgi:predicted nucleic acid-binding protein
VRAVLDTNILVDYLRGSEQARLELARYERASISLVTWMEILVGARGPDEEARLRGFLSRFDRLPIDDAIASGAVSLRRERRLRLPDAIIWATARASEALLVTRNTRDFPADDPGVRVPYETP